MTKKRSNTGNNYFIPNQPRLGRVRYKLKGEPFYRVIENVSKSKVKSEIHKLFPDSKIEYLGTFEEYENYGDAYRRKYQENYMKQKNYEDIS